MRAPDRSGQADALARLERDGIVERDRDRHRTTRRWKGAMARAAASLATVDGGGGPFDLRVPIVFALVELYGDDHPDDELTRFVEVLLPIESAELDPTVAASAPPGG